MTDTKAIVAEYRLQHWAQIIQEQKASEMRIPIYPDRYSDFNADSIPKVCGQYSGGIRTAFRRYSDKHIAGA
jgi:hypothetical protein